MKKNEDIKKKIGNSDKVTKKIYLKKETDHLSSKKNKILLK